MSGGGSPEEGSAGLTPSRGAAGAGGERVEAKAASPGDSPPLRLCPARLVLDGGGHGLCPRGARRQRRPTQSQEEPKFRSGLHRPPFSVAVLPPRSSRCRRLPVLLRLFAWGSRPHVHSLAPEEPRVRRSLGSKWPRWLPRPRPAPEQRHRRFGFIPTVCPEIPEDRIDFARPRVAAEAPPKPAAAAAAAARVSGPTLELRGLRVRSPRGRGALRPRGFRANPAPRPRTARRGLSDPKVRLWKKVIWFSAGREMKAGVERCMAARGKVRSHGGG